jgi:hypothetical protein
MHRVRTLIMSKAEPFISKLATECQLSPDEIEALKSFVPNFRKIMGAYIDLTLRRKPDYLKHEVKAFEELSNGLCLTLYIARLCSHASPQATDFSLSMLGVTLPVILGTGNLCNEEILHFTRDLANITHRKPDRHVHKKSGKLFHRNMKWLCNAEGPRKILHTI